MQAIRHITVRLIRNQAAASAVEYGLILSLVVLAMMGALVQFAGATTDMWNFVSTKVLEVAG
nr:Flp family type IVb pilin [Stakelama sediminis]